MSGKRATDIFPFPHLTVVPTTTHELLFDYTLGHLPTPNLGIIALEAFEQEAPEIVLSTLGQAGLVASSFQIDAARQHATQSSRFNKQIHAAKSRRIAASKMIQLASQKLRTDYYEPVEGEQDEFAERFQFKRQEFQTVLQRIKQFDQELPLLTLRELEKARPQGIAAREITTAQRILALLYDSTLHERPAVSISDREPA